MFREVTFSTCNKSHVVCLPSRLPLPSLPASAWSTSPLLTLAFSSRSALLSRLRLRHRNDPLHHGELDRSDAAGTPKALPAHLQAAEEVSAEVVPGFDTFVDRKTTVPDFRATTATSRSPATAGTGTSTVSSCAPLLWSSDLAARTSRYVRRSTLDPRISC